jgi:hypothetical protein
MPKINKKTFEELFEDDRNLAMLYTPEWRPGSERDFGIALLKIFAHMKEEITSRLNRVPERNFTAFLNMLGIKLMLAQPARVPVTFFASEGLNHGIFIPAGTQVVAPASERHESLTFETMSALTATSSPLIELFSVDPEADAIYRHTDAFNNKEAISLFKGDNLQSHVLFLGHSKLFKVGPTSSISLRFKLADQSFIDYNFLDWQCWTEKGMLKLEKAQVEYEVLKGTPGELQVTLTPDQVLKETEVNGISSLWIACSLKSPIDLDEPPALKDIKIGDIASISDDVMSPDMAFYNFVPLNLRKDFYPFGMEPRLFDTFYIASREAFSKKNANITITFRRKVGSSIIDPKANSVELSFEYWNGKLWRDLDCDNAINNLALNNLISNYVFSWDEIPGKDNERLLEFLTRKFGVDWVKTAKLDKIDIDKTIKVCTEKNSISLKLNDKRTEVILEIDGVGTDKFTAKMETDKLNIYKSYYVGTLIFDRPSDFQETDVCGETNYWIRIRLVNGDYGREEIKENPNNFATDLKDYYNHIKALDESNANDKITAIKNLEKDLENLKNDLENRKWIVNKNYTPPWLTQISIIYNLTGSEEKLEHCISYNNMEYRDLLKEQIKATDIGQKKGTAYCFIPFLPLPDSRPTIHIGFKGPFGRGKMSIFFSVIQAMGSANIRPDFEWSYWGQIPYLLGENVIKQVNLETIDNTDHLSRSDTLEFLAPGDQVGTVSFGKDCFWLMGALTEGFERETAGVCDLPDLKGIYSNTVWAEQVETVNDEILGSSDGEKGQSFSFMRIPVISPRVWVREGAVILRDDSLLLSSAGHNIQEIKDKTGKVVDAWVEWKAAEDFYSSGPKSRHYIIDGSSGRISFGDGSNGMIPPIGRDNIKASYKTGGGVKGNLSAGEISAIRTPLAGIDRVTNNEPAEGGSDTETLEQIFERGPNIIRSLDRAVTEEDFERLAKAASSFIARTRCFLKDNRLKVVVIPKGEGDRPKPSPGLLRTVERYIEEKRLSTISSADLEILEPTYKEVSVTASIIPESMDIAVPLETEIMKKLKEFLHPLTGGSEGRGWEFGRDIHISEVYTLLEGIPGVDHVKELLLNGSEVNPVTVAESEMVCSGDHKINITMDGETGR